MDEGATGLACSVTVWSGERGRSRYEGRRRGCFATSPPHKCCPIPVAAPYRRRERPIYGNSCGANPISPGRPKMGAGREAARETSGDNRAEQSQFVPERH